MKPDEDIEEIVTLICANSHEWQTKATEVGMARPVSGHPNKSTRSAVFENDTCPKPTCGLKGYLKK
jgi:hypothetical protein